MNFVRTCFAILFILISTSLFSQSSSYIIPNREKEIYFGKLLNSTENNFHSSIKPFINASPLDTLSNFKKEDIEKGIFQIAPIVNLNFNGQSSYKSGYFLMSEGGLSITLSNNKKLSVNGSFLSGLSAFPSYIHSNVLRMNVAPGMGIVYENKTGYSYQYYFGYISYSPNRIFNFQIGRDKNFFGDGYRSLFLSDVSNSYPFLKLSATVWKIKYVSMFTLLKDVSTSIYRNDFKNKYGVFHYLSWNTSKRINLNIFESVIWQGSDSNRVRSFDVNYLNPVIFYRPVEYSLGSSDNSFLGMGFKIKAGAKYSHQFYGQLLLDEFLLEELKKMNGWWGNKYGVQAGYKYFNAFGIKNLQLQTEVNRVRPYTYSHGSTFQNYSHYNQPLAHPMGANFTESVSFLNYHYKRWFIEAELLYAILGKDYFNTHYGGNIFTSYSTRPNEYGNKTGQGLRTTLSYNHLKIAYTLLPSMNLIAEAGIALRKEENLFGTTSSSLFFIGIKTRFMNRYSDF